MPTWFSESLSLLEEKLSWYQADAIYGFLPVLFICLVMRKIRKARKALR